MSHPLWSDLPLDPELATRLATLSQQLQATAVARDAAGSNPADEALLLKQAGLTGLTLAPLHGDPATVLDPVADQQRWRLALALVRRLARVDLSPAALLGYNYMTLLRLENSGDTPAFRAALASMAGSGAIWGGTNNPKGPAARLVRVRDGYRLDGRKTFATGSQSADFIVIGEGTETAAGARRLSFVLPADTPGLSHGDDWTAFGARRTASGSILFNDVFVPEAAVFRDLDASGNAQEIERSSGSLSYQALFINLLVGAAQGAVEQALEYLDRRAEPLAGIDKTYILEILGCCAAEANAAAALADRADLALARLISDRRAKHLSAAERGELGDVILQAKIVADRVGLEVTSKVIEAVGARAAARAEGFDRIWRDVRTYTLHDPVVMRAREVGHFWTRRSAPGGIEELAGYHSV